MNIVEASAGGESIVKTGRTEKYCFATAQMLLSQSSGCVRPKVSKMGEAEKSLGQQTRVLQLHDATPPRVHGYVVVVSRMLDFTLAEKDPGL